MHGGSSIFKPHHMLELLLRAMTLIAAPRYLCSFHACQHTIYSIHTSVEPICIQVQAWQPHVSVVSSCCSSLMLHGPYTRFVMLVHATRPEHVS